MSRGKPTQSITVVPDSGTDELKGLVGSMTIDIDDGKHFYTIAYTLEGTYESSEVLRAAFMSKQELLHL